jgi:hypothetical protein
MTAEQATALSARYDIDYVVTEVPMASLHEVYRNERFHIYDVQRSQR